MITDRLEVSVSQFEQQTGWELKPEGACRGELCVPLPAGAVSSGTVALAAVADRLGMPIIADEEAGLYALGPASLGGRTLPTVDAPELTLPTIDGDEFRLSSLRGQKVVLVAWAPY